jgi:hypothetical protein
MRRCGVFMKRDSRANLAEQAMSLAREHWELVEHELREAELSVERNASPLIQIVLEVVRADKQFMRKTGAIVPATAGYSDQQAGRSVRRTM